MVKVFITFSQQGCQPLILILLAFLLTVSVDLFNIVISSFLLPIFYLFQQLPCCHGYKHSISFVAIYSGLHVHPFYLQSNNIICSYIYWKTWCFNLTYNEQSFCDKGFYLCMLEVLNKIYDTWWILLMILSYLEWR